VYLDTAEESDEPSANSYLEFNKLSAEHRAKKRRKISHYSLDTKFDRYTKHFSHRDEKIKDPLKWCRQHESDFPILLEWPLISLVFQA
jgi:hypothetical protein